MTGDSFEGILDRLGAGLADIDATSDVPDVLGVASIVTSADGTITVTVQDGRVVSIEVVERRVDPHLWPFLIATINDALARNQEEVLAELQHRSPSLESLQRLTQQTSADLRAAFSTILDRLP